MDDSHCLPCQQLGLPRTAADQRCPACRERFCSRHLARGERRQQFAVSHARLRFTYGHECAGVPRERCLNGHDLTAPGAAYTNPTSGLVKCVACRDAAQLRFYEREKVAAAAAGLPVKKWRALRRAGLTDATPRDDTCTVTPH